MIRKHCLLYMNSEFTNDTGEKYQSWIEHNSEKISLENTTVIIKYLGKAS